MGLDYLGLGDWHDQRQIGPATWYSGTPETDGFKHETAPAALVVRIAARGTPAQATTVPTEQFRWCGPGWTCCRARMSLPGWPGFFRRDAAPR